MSLLGVEDTPVCPPVQIVISDRRNSGPAVIIPNPSHQLHVLTPSLTPSTNNTDPDIQLARSDPDKVWSVTTLPPTHISSSLQSVCGPKPAKLTTICMAMQMVVSLAGFGPHTDWREEEMCVGGRVVTLHTLSGSDLANCMSGSVLLVEGVRDGVNTCSWWLGLGMITAGPEFRLSDITI